MDRVSTEQRSRNMARIRARGNKTTEWRLRAHLMRAGISGWRMHGGLLGRPDFVFPKAKLAVFVDGCFWHFCPTCGHLPRSNVGYWTEKLRRNRIRDRHYKRQLEKLGWCVLRLWEHEVRESPESAVEVIRSRGRKRPHPRRTPNYPGRTPVCT